MYNKTQLFKGIYEGCILRIIQTHDAYGYKIVSTLQEMGFTEVKEGTIYPLLLRLEKNGLIRSEFRISQIGPSRKYYEITEEGIAYLNEFYAAWYDTVHMVDKIFQTKEDPL